MDERIVDIETSLQVLATDKREEHHSPIATSHTAFFFNNTGSGETP